MRIRWVWLSVALLFAGELTLGLYMSVVNGFINGDALSRAANAFYVLYSRDPHLAAIGFIWNPLPSLLALPILVFQPVFPQLSSAGVSVILVSAIFAALTPYLIWSRLAKSSQVPGAIGKLCIFLLALNPLQFWYGANGMSEALFGFTIVLAVVHWSQWLSNGQVQSLVTTSLALALAFLTRYEAVPFAAAMIIATIFVFYSRKASFRKIESIVIILALPIFCAAISWIWLNYTIMGDPFYFLHAAYSNQGQSAFLGENHVFERLIGHPLPSLLFVAQRSAVFLIPYLVIAAIRFPYRLLLRADFIALSLITFSIPLFQWVMIISGSSYGWLRFFYYPLLISAAWMPYEFSLAEYRQNRGRVFRIAIASAFAASALLVIPVMNNPTYAPEEYTAIHYRDSDLYLKSAASKQNAQILDEEIFAKYPETLVLADSFNAFDIILQSRYPGRFVNTTDRDFKTVLADPLKYDTKYILVPKPEGLNNLNAVNARFPGLYDDKLHWAKLVKELNGDWRLFEVTSSPTDSR